MGISSDLNGGGLVTFLSLPSIRATLRVPIQVTGLEQGWYWWTVRLTGRWRQGEARQGEAHAIAWSLSAPPTSCSPPADRTFDYLDIDRALYSSPATMFWRFGGYANISTIDTILDKPDFTLEELLDESDLIQELKQHNTKLIEYLREDKVLKKLLDYVVAPKLEVVATPDEIADDELKARNRLLPFSRPGASRASDTDANDDDEQEKKRNRYAFVACEVLSSDTWSIYEALTENRDLVRNFWGFLSRPAPLDPLQASYFTKVNESLFEKKTEDMMKLLRGLPDAVPNLLKHVECPMIMDLLLKIIALDRSEGGQGVVEWLYSKDIIPSLLACLSPENSWVMQTAAGEFIKAIITISANASQNEQQCIGPNELTRQLVSKPCVEQLISYMLGGGNPLTVGVGIIIEVIRKNNSDYDPDVGTESNAVPSSRDPIYLGTLLRLFAQNVPKFMSFIMDAPTQKASLASTFGDKLQPLGFDRFKTCELMAELLHCSNMGLLNEVGSEQLIAIRDAHRTQLRTEGKLGPQKEGEGQGEDLTMRASQQTQDDNRRLEVTNADDDGFEEVEPSKEMSEDTSHEFVKAEEDIPAAPLASFLEKDDDEFVDEPLSSPRLATTEDKIHEQRFEEPDLVVPPLSPTKPKTTPQDQDGSKSPAVQSSELSTTAKDEADTTVPAVGGATSDAHAGSSAIPAPLSPSGNKPAALDVATAAEAVGSESGRALSPHPEDKPAPLFAAPPSPEGSKGGELMQTPVETPAETLPTSQSSIGESVLATTVLHPPAGESQKEDDPAPVEPVVGDYLKMQFVEHRVVPTILSFFFAYPWNNFLHNVVYDIVQQVFNGPMDRGYNPTLAVSLFEAADVTTAIINGQKASDESQAKTKTRMGYMGHLTLIAEEVVKFTERNPPELLSETVLDRVMSQDWINYVEGALAETRERDNAILGGVRPEVALGHRGSISGQGLGGVGLSGLGSGSGNQSVGVSSALSDAGLNGGIELNENGGNGVGPFAISGGTLMSGFGSSSDEEDEDGDNDEEDVNSEVSDHFLRGRGKGFFEASGLADSPEDIIMRSPELIHEDSLEPDTDMETYMAPAPHSSGNSAQITGYRDELWRREEEDDEHMEEYLAGSNHL
ncbi:Extragenic suppressor of kinetochore protein 1 [Paramyrothecium foliicola]|nr:Extragenic suppressor of kinetochore protein 1 [Paramyrothecium foliicola]